MIGIRTKLSLGFLGLLLILMLVGVRNILLLNELGGSIDLILRENYRSVIACQDMKEALERIDSGLLYSLLDHQPEGKALVKRNLEVFAEALHVQLNNITLPEEDQKSSRIENLFNDYVLVTKAVLDQDSDLEKRRNIYFADSVSLFREIKFTADEILHMNQAKMSKSSHDAGMKVAEARNTMIGLIGLGLLVASGFMILVGKWILRPISSLTNAAKEIKSGNLDVVIQSCSQDEIGQLAKTVDGMAASLREFKRTDQAHLLRVRRSTEQAFNVLPDAVVLLDAVGKIELVNKAASESFGFYSNQELPIQSAPFFTRLYYQALNGQPYSEPYSTSKIIQRFVHGEEKFFNPRAIPILDHEKRTTGVILLLSDITQEHHQNELKKSVVATAAHQLRTPLTSVRMALHLLLEEKVGPLTQKQLELTLAAKEDGDRLYLIIERLLSIGRIESGKAELDRRSVCSNELVFDSSEPFRKKAIDEGIILGIDLPPDLPAVDADPLLVSQVFANLLSNSLKYTGPGGSIKISAIFDEESVIFSVSDSGKGIPQRYLKKILDQFFRVPGQVGETGVGLGLSIVQEIVTAHGGILGVESKEGQGSKFTFSLRRSRSV